MVTAKIAAKVRMDTRYKYKKVGLSGSPFYVLLLWFTKGLLTKGSFAKAIL